MAEISVRVPLRIDLAGGWTDVPDFAAREGGAVLNVAIDRYVEGSARWDQGGLSLSYRLDLPPDSHLGSSSAIDLAWLRLTFGLLDQVHAPEALAEKVFALERVLGEKGGKQDEYASALGGINLLRFGGLEEPVQVEPLIFDPARRSEFEERLVLCHAGPSEGSSDTHKRVWQRFRDGDHTVTDALRALKSTVEPARDAVLAGDYIALGALLNRNREASRFLHAATVTGHMDSLFEAAEAAGALGGKPCGAGGGGCILLLCDAGARERVEEALRSRGGQLIAFHVAPRTN